MMSLLISSGSHCAASVHQVPYPPEIGGEGGRRPDEGAELAHGLFPKHGTFIT